MSIKNKNKKFYYKRVKKFYEEVDKRVKLEVIRILHSKKFTERLKWVVTGIINFHEKKK